MSFYGLRDHLIQQQWQLDQEQQWRVKHESPRFGSFALLPLEIRSQIYEACFPAECVEVDLVKVPADRRLHCGLVSLMRSTRCIHDEIKPLLGKHMQSRLFNLILSKKGVRFERNQFVIDFLTHERLQSMTSDTIPSLGVFSRTRKSIRYLRLAIQIAPSAVPAPGLVGILEPFAMWVFSLLSTAGALQFLLVEFHLSHEMATDQLTDDDDGSGKSIGNIIRVLLGNRTAKHCQRVMEVALASELQVVRVVILQRDEDESQQGRKVSSFCWNRSEQDQQHAHKLPDQPATRTVSRPTPQSPSQSAPPRVSQEPTTQQPVPEQTTPQQPVSDQPVSKEPVLEQTATEQPLSEKPVPEQPVLEKPVHEQSVHRAPHPLPQPTVQSTAALVHQSTAKGLETSSGVAPAQGNPPPSAARVEERNSSPEYSPPPPEINKDTLDHQQPIPEQPTRHVPQPMSRSTPALAHQLTVKRVETSSNLSSAKVKLPTSAARAEEQDRSPESSPPPPEVNEDALNHQQPIPEQPNRHVPQPMSRSIPALAHQPTAKRRNSSSDLSHEKGNLLSSAARVEEKSSSPEYSPPPLQVRKDSLDHPTQPIEILDTSESPNKSADLPTTDPISPEARPSQAVLSRNLEQETSRRSQKKRKLDLGERASTTESQAGSSRKKPKRAASNSKPPSPAIEAASEKEEYVVKSLRDARIRNGVAEIQVKWKGYGPDQMTWEPRTTLMEDVPDMVREFDRRQPKLSKSGSRANSEQMSSKKSQKLTVKPSVEALQEGTETPRAATARMNQWASQQLQASQKSQTEQQRQASPSASLPPKPKLASQAPPSASLSQKPKLASQASLSASVAQKPKLASQAPKRPLTSYFLYMQANRPRLWDDLCKQLGNPELVTPARISTEGTRRWLHMDNEEKGVWDRIYAKRLAIYHIQMEAFKAGKPIPSQEEARSLVESSTKQSAVVDLT